MSDLNDLERAALAAQAKSDKARHEADAAWEKADAAEDAAGEAETQAQIALAAFETARARAQIGASLDGGG